VRRHQNCKARAKPRVGAGDPRIHQKSEALRKNTDGQIIRSKTRSNPALTTRINSPYFIRPFSL
jgi:hypothetical protein